MSLTNPIMQGRPVRLPHSSRVLVPRLKNVQYANKMTPFLYGHWSADVGSQLGISVDAHTTYVQPEDGHHLFVILVTSAMTHLCSDGYCYKYLLCCLLLTTLSA